MVGVLEFMRRSRKMLVSQHIPLDTTHPKVLELQTAKELLAETFGISVLEVEEIDPIALREKGAVAGELLSGVSTIVTHGHDASSSAQRCCGGEIAAGTLAFVSFCRLGWQTLDSRV